MYRHGAVLVALLLALTPALGAVGPVAAQGSGDCGFPVTRTDATETAVTVSERPDRIVTLSPSAAQTLWEVGAADRVVGTTQFASYLNGTDETATLRATDGGVDVERVVGLGPDLVFAPGTVSTETVDRLRRAGVTTVALETPATVEGVAAKTTQTGRLVGACDGAARTNAWMRVNVAAVREATADEPRPAALYVLGGGFTAGNGTFVDDVFRVAGLRNVAAEAGVDGFARVSPEVVRERDPAWFVRSPGTTVPDEPAYAETRAARENRTAVVDGNWLNQPAPRSIVRATRALAAAVHGVDPAPVSRDVVPEATTTGTPAETPTSGAGHGFGAVAAGAALAATALAARARR